MVHAEHMGTTNTAMRSLFGVLRSPLLHVAGFSFVVNLLLLVPAIFMLEVFDRVLSSGSTETLIALLLGVAIALMLLFALDYLRSRLQGCLLYTSPSPRDS